MRSRGRSPHAPASDRLRNRDDGGHHRCDRERRSTRGRGGGGRLRGRGHTERRRGRRRFGRLDDDDHGDGARPDDRRRLFHRRIWDVSLLLARGCGGRAPRSPPAASGRGLRVPCSAPVSNFGLAAVAHLHLRLTLSDYDDAVNANPHERIRLTAAAARVDVAKVDSAIGGGGTPQAYALLDRAFDLIIGADVVYEREHASSRTSSPRCSPTRRRQAAATAARSSCSTGGHGSASLSPPSPMSAPRAASSGCGRRVRNGPPAAAGARRRGGGRAARPARCSA